MSRRTRTSLVAGLALALLVLAAGCGKPASTPLTVDGKPAPGLPGKVLYGHVLDDEFLPLAGANVSLPDDGIHATTNETGYYQIAGLEPRDYIVLGAQAGHETRAMRAPMVMGRQFELDFVLPTLPTGDPHHETQTFRAFIACQVAVRTDFPGWIRQDCGAADPNNAKVGSFSIGPHTTGFVFEAHWTPNVGCAETLSVELRLTPAEAASFPIEDAVMKTGDRLLVPASYYGWVKRTGGDIRVLLDANNCEGNFAGLMLQQRVDLYLTAFYFEELPADFSAVAGA